MKKENYSFSNGEITVWKEQEAVHIKAIDSHGDPVELTAEEAVELAKALSRLAMTLENAGEESL